MILADEHGKFSNVSVGPRVLALEEFVDFPLGVGSPNYSFLVGLFRSLRRLASSVYPGLWSEQIYDGKFTCNTTDAKGCEGEYIPCSCTLFFSNSMSS